jgi:cytochrome c oxidase subunit I+III
MLLVAGSLYLSYVFSYLYLWTVSPQVWPQSAALPAWPWPAASALLLLIGSGAVVLASRSLPDRRRTRGRCALLLALGLVALVGALGVDVASHWRHGLEPSSNAHAAMIGMALFLQAQIVIPVAVMACFVLARLFAGRLDAAQRGSFDNLALLWHYGSGQGLLGLLLLHGFPRAVA